ncbi:class IV adenylate cyclase [Pseudodesulfovibrio sp.]|nr:class IV adenylate cyclase [Pseudodesulfovibrio sp.]
MALECELKYLDADLEKLSRRLKEAGGQCLGRYFESNLVFDYEDRSLKKVGILLRLREKEGKAVLTVKRPPDKKGPESLKVFEEIESVVDDFHTVKSALETVGFSIAFSYEKVREKWLFEDCVICLDLMPFGDFVEIEGTEKMITRCAKKLNLDNNPTSKLTYHALNIEHRRSEGLDDDESFVFPDDKKAMLINELGKE